MKSAILNMQLWQSKLEIKYYRHTKLVLETEMTFKIRIEAINNVVIEECKIETGSNWWNWKYQNSTTHMARRISVQVVQLHWLEL